MLTARSESEDKLKGFECGADDYVTKPFSPNIRAIELAFMKDRRLAFLNDFIENSFRLKVQWEC
jgi:DNA-binding response OmpR family regulator